MYALQFNVFERGWGGEPRQLCVTFAETRALEMCAACRQDKARQGNKKKQPAKKHTKQLEPRICADLKSRPRVCVLSHKYNSPTDRSFFSVAQIDIGRPAYKCVLYTRQSVEHTMATTHKNTTRAGVFAISSAATVF